MILQIGQRLGPYQIEELLGQGGMGEVYRAKHVLLRRMDAVKVMHPNLAADPAFRARFEQEGQAIARLDHPNIVRVYDFFEDHAQLFLALEFVPNGTLRTLQGQWATLPTRPLPLGLDLVRQAALGLAYAHAQGMVHRDIKPDNLLLRRQAEVSDQHLPGAYQLKISDFGLARLLEGGTQTMTMMGTPAYMSPEQCQGLALDGRSDQYSLGAVLYELATGYRLFQAQTPSGMYYNHINTPPQRPSSFNQAISPALDEIILTCLAKRPEERYPSCVALAQRLAREAQSILSGAPASPTASTVRADLGQPAGAPMVPPVQRPTRMETPASSGTPTAVQPSVDIPAMPLAAPGVAAPGVAAPGVAAPGVVAPGAAPRLRVAEADGRTLYYVDLRAGVLLQVGRDAGNNVVLNDTNISRRHLRLDWDGQRAVVTDLGSSNGTFVGRTRLPSGMPVPWPGGEALRVGCYWLLLELPSPRPGGPSPAVPIPPVFVPSGGFTPTVQDPATGATGIGMGMSMGMSMGTGTDMLTGGVSDPAGGPPPSPSGLTVGSPPSSPSSSQRIAMTLDPPTLSLMPGTPATLTVGLTNAGTIVDHFTVTVEGEPAAWATNAGQGVQLNPGAQGQVHLSINVPRVPQSHAGVYQPLIRAQSRENPSESAWAQASWEVQRFAADDLQVRPLLATGRGAASYTITVTNNGNAPVGYELTGEDAEDKLRFAFGTNPLVVEPGPPTSARLRVQGSTHILGRATQHSLVVHSRANNGTPPRAVPVQFANEPLLPQWSLTALGSAVGLLAVGATLLVLLTRPGGGSTSSKVQPDWTATASYLQTQAALAVDASVKQTVAAQQTSAAATASAQQTVAAQQTIAAQQILSSGDNGLLRGTWYFDFESGKMTSSASDIWWEQQTSIQRQMAPTSGAALKNLGIGSLDSVSLDQLRALTYSANPIRGNADSSNQLVPNDIFAVRTRNGNYAKVQVVTYGYDLTIRWVTYKG